MGIRQIGFVLHYSLLVASFDRAQDRCWFVGSLFPSTALRTGVGYSPKGFPFRYKIIHYTPFTNDDFWRVSADTKTCPSTVLGSALLTTCRTGGSPLNICHLYGGLYYTKFREKVKKKVLYKHINSGALGT